MTRQVYGDRGPARHRACAISKGTMADESLYEKVLAQIEGGDRLPESRPPRSSASVVLWRRKSGDLEVFWIKRARTMRFMGGFYAFPGGGLSRQDRGVATAGLPQGHEDGPAEAAMPAAVTDGLKDLGPVLCDGLVACALRELHEETGLSLSPDADAGRLVYAGRWLTPPLGPLRFDNRFFLLEWSPAEAEQPRVASREAEVGEWIRPAEALELWKGGEVVTAPPILHILRVLLEEGPEQGLPRLRNPTEANLGPHRRVEFRPGVLLFPQRTPTLPPASYTNCYVLGNEETVLVDPGSPYEVEIDRLARALEALESAEGRRVRAIWLTHHHPDHVGGVRELRRRLGVPVAAHRLTAERLAEMGIPVDEELTDGQEVVLGRGFPVRILHTPGHARGHLCFLEQNHGSMLVGDLIAGFGTIVIDPPEGNMEDYLDSLRRIRDVAPQALFPAHGPATVAAVAKLDEYVQHRQWREGRILAAWQGGLRQPAAMLESVYDDVPPMARLLAERQIVAHLESLETSGKLEK